MFGRRLKANSGGCSYQLICISSARHAPGAGCGGLKAAVGAYFEAKARKMLTHDQILKAARLMGQIPDRSQRAVVSCEFYSPVYTTHDHGRKTHLGISGIVLCGTDKRFPGLLWNWGNVYTDIEKQFLTDPDGVGCRLCAAIYRKRERM